MHPARKARLEAGLNYRQLAERSGLSSETLKKIEDGRRVKPLSIFRVATALELDPEELLGEEHKAVLDLKQPA
jgi:transcriptional regulator with XRE-family HTH domain